MHSNRARLLTIGAITLSAMFFLSACGGTTETASTADAEVSEEAEPTEEAMDEEAEEEEESFALVLNGTGSYMIGTEAPYGGYQLSGEPASQPDGCTWSIVDADGVVYVENQGSYAFITDIPEAVTFNTDGCPDWEQFE